MNKYSLIIYSFLALGLLSCEDKLEQAPISDASAANFFRNATDFEQAVNGVYGQLRPVPERYYDLSETRSDNVYGSSSTGVRPWDPINDFVNTIENNELVAEAWNNNFNGIMRANTVLDRLNATAVPEEALRSRFEGEARFLRAFYYFDLVRWFGKVPLYDRVVTPTEALEIPRSSVQEVYNLILADLNRAIELLPPTYNAENKGRATSWAAKALLARVHLTRSGPSYGIEGPGLGANEYSEALTLLNDVINNGPFTWVNNYASIFSYNNENNPDIVFDVQFQSGQIGVGTTLPGYMGTPPYFNSLSGNIALPQSSVEMREIADDLLNDYAENDVRKAATIQQGFTDPNGFVETRAFYRKFLDETATILDRFDWPINFPLIRYTDVLMMKAEAILQGASGGTQQEVDEIVNMVRARAGLGPVANVTLDMLLKERRLEFAGEGLRWHDLVRTGTVIDKMNAWLPTEDELNRMPESIGVNSIIYPIPFTQLTVKEGLYQQNPGY
ncbi:RagB/SusD family nutrient uptake outer membrane protein [Pontibacter beigongshangensis]|uniref:RagB/SusD family nutrient uptake outer membrane protein n=1 Tax=Pontibacter beigongshangensis TaxID=2574733 RepID=UPI001650C54B|nr:RagB/SusD family nutrient uptake outer membrane protein [Pontibacter beigongshangensis]